MEQVNIQFNLDEKEYIEAVQNYILKKNKIKQDIFVALSLVGFGIFLWGFNGYSIFWLLSILVGVFFISVVYAIYFIIPPLRFKKDPMLHNRNIITINDEGIKFRCSGFVAEMKWSNYSEILENEKYFYLVSGKNMYSIIPKKAFNIEEIEVFKSKVNNKLSIKILD